jgi:hypothetical protein
MKSLKAVILFLSILSIVSCSQAGFDQKSADGNQAAAELKSSVSNAIPYPLKEWKGVQGKTLADSKPDFIGQPKAPTVRPMYSLSCWMTADIRVRLPTGASCAPPRSIGSGMKVFAIRTCPWPRSVPRRGAHC